MLVGPKNVPWMPLFIAFHFLLVSRVRTLFESGWMIPTVNFFPLRVPSSTTESDDESYSPASRHRQE